MESMQAVEQALLQPHGLSQSQILARLQDWRQLVTELAGSVTQGSELAILYEVIQVLNSSLDLTETLNLVMDSLISLTGAERGCLMLCDEDELSIRAARNFDQEGVDSSDLDLSLTVVRDAVDSGQPVLTTNAQRDPRFSGHESVIGYQLRSVVCVPLRVRGRVIGALYLDNRIREAVFSEADLPMLIAFANQAAIAIENARLYTLTDQALAARVEELTTLQQIDRELNASLDFQRVLDLTLKWALKGTGAAKGALRVVDEDESVRTVSCVGNGGVGELEADMIRQALGSHEPVLLGNARMLVPIRCEDRVVGLLELYCDATTRNDHLQFVSRLADHAAIAIENARLYEQVDQANRAKSEFVSFVAHELRTPMTAIRGYADMLEKQIVGPLTPQQADFIRTILSNAERMQVLVSDLQDVSRIETGQLRLEVKQVQLAETLKSALETARPYIESRSQRLKVEMPDDLPLVQADPARLTQVLINLLSNASKYTPESGRVGLTTWLKAGFVHCAISDTGVGIAPEDQARLFTKFFRSEDPCVRKMPGTGLGLCIVKSLVELQGGEVTVESQVGKGSVFTFTVPVAAG
jgi:signal transduction histidine kinase